MMEWNNCLNCVRTSRLITTENLFNAALNNCECITFVSFLFCVSDILTCKNIEKIQNSLKNIL